ncbi:P-loop containing nucleoside triphosphate hydrolase protein [Cyathus striatus]|nr:P-loop containing nucleoside triphosphate hydrolase protein [Cyathus striatus]
MDHDPSFMQNCGTSENVPNNEKRRLSPDNVHSGPGDKQGKGKKLCQDNDQAMWPQYFHDALSAVLAFVSSKNSIPTTYTTVKSSVENLLKFPLEISSIAELKALLPDLIIFSYSQSDSIQVEEPQERTAVRKQTQVLVLDFKDRPKGQRTRNYGFQYRKPPKSTNASLQKILHKRNDMFREAVNELLRTFESPENAVEYLRRAAYQHMPTDPTTPSSSNILRIPDPENRISMNDVISQIKNERFYHQQLVFRRTIEAKKAKIVTLDPPLSPMISQVLVSCRKISLFYSHQVAAIHAISNGKNVVVSTSTASGKSLIYQVPILKHLEQNPDVTAILVYPTKAYTYDGDTAQESRAIIRQAASLLFTNFDTLHMSILPYEELWRRYFFIDMFNELHYYSGLLGRKIVRRLRRLCAAVGNRHVQFVSCTATIFNPLSHMQVLTGLAISDIVVILEDGAPSGQKDILLWNPRANREDSKTVESSGISEATTLMIYLMTRGIRVILFCKVGISRLYTYFRNSDMYTLKLRKVCELAMKSLITTLGNEGRHDILQRVKPYRGGYSATERRAIERDAFSGHLLGIIATNALELGVDIGILDAVIMLGFPGTISSFRQQAGRAGRRARDSLAILIADPFPIDQHYLEHPTELFEQKSDDINIDINSLEVLEAHLQCAAYEMPICATDETYFGPTMLQICEEKLSKDNDGWFYTNPELLPFPAKDISIRGAIEDKYTVIRVRSSGKADIVLEELEVSRAMFELYEGGVFMHQGMAFVVKEINHDLQLAIVLRANVNYITSPRDYTNVDALETRRIKEFPTTRAFYGRVNIYVKVFGFFKIKDNVILDAVELETPAWDRETTGFWIDVSETTLNLLKENQIAPSAAIHSAQHAFLNQFYLARDVGTECKAPEKEYKATESRRKRPARLIFYDSIGKGGGVATKAFDNSRWLFALG